MPVLDLCDWSQFILTGMDGSALAGTAVFQGGTPSITLLQEDEQGRLFLDQAMRLGEATIAPGALVTVTGQARSRAGTHPVVAFDGEPAGLAIDPEAAVPGQSFAFETPDTPPPLKTDPFRGVVCFAAGTQLATPDGPKRVETLRPGMELITADTGAQPILWTGRREVLFNRNEDRYRPILVRANALGPRHPDRDLIVSPDHCMLLTGPEVRAGCGQDEVLVPASALVGLRGIRPMHGKRRVTYVNVMLKDHAILAAEGAAAESFYPERAALAALGDAQRASLFDACPALRSASGERVGAPARPFLDHQTGAALARHLKTAWRASGTSSALAAE